MMSDSERNGSGAVSLGCGTLIIIALIVIFLGRPDLEPMENELAGLREEVAALNTQIGLLRTEVQTLRLDERQDSDAGSAPDTGGDGTDPAPAGE